MLVAVAGLTWVPSAHATAPGAEERKLPTLTLPGVAPKPPAPSRVPIVIGVDLEWAKAVLEERIPVLLHQETNREIASGVVVDVKVTRGAVDLKLENETVTLHSPVQLDLKVRSRLGSFVVPVGQCQPIVDVDISALPKLNPDGTLPQPTAKAQLRTPCRLSGLDATPFLQREVEQQLSKAEGLARKQLDKFNSVAAAVLRDTLSRFSNHVAGCLRFLPSRIKQGRPTNVANVAVLRFVVEGQLRTNCELPPTTGVVVDGTTEDYAFDLAWQRQIPWSDLASLLSRQVEGSEFGGTVSAIRSVQRDGADRIAIFVRNARQQGWVFSQPQLVEGMVRLTNLEATDVEFLVDVRPALEAFSLPVDAVAVEALGRQVVSTSNALTQVLGPATRLQQQYRIDDADLRTVGELKLSPNALLVIMHRQQSPTSDVR